MNAPVPILALTGQTVTAWCPQGPRVHGTDNEVHRMARHVADIARRRGVTITSHSKGGRAWAKGKRVAIRPVCSLTTYAIAMHELGHVLGAGRTAPRLEAEANAWAWAERNRLAFTGRGDMGATWQQVQADALASYLRWCCARNDWQLDQRVVPTSDRPEPAGYRLEVEVGEVRPGCPSLPPEGHVWWRMLEGTTWVNVGESRTPERPLWQPELERE